MLDQIEQQRRQKRQDEAQLHERTMAQIGRENLDRHQALDDEFARRLADQEAALAEARRAWQAAIDTARQRRQQREGDAAGGLDDWHWRDVDPDRPARWRRSLRFKRYAIETAIEHEMDAVMFLRFPDIMHTRGPKAMLTLFEQEEAVRWSWLPIVAGDEAGTPTRRMRKMPGRVDRLDPAGKITEEGFMLRLAGFDASALEDITSPAPGTTGSAEPIVIMDELLQRGHGQGVRRYEGEALHYVAARPPHVDADVARGLPSALRERMEAELRRS